MAVLLDGVAEYLSVQGARNQLRNVGVATVCLWARADIVPVTTNRIMMKWSNGTGNNTTRASIGFTTASQLEVAGRALDGDALSTLDFVAGVFTQGPWQHVVVVFNFTKASCLVYMNGGSSVSAGSFTNMTAGNTSDTASLTGGIGGAGAPAGNSFWPGALDDLRIYQRVLSPSEIATIYTAKGTDGIEDAALAGRWPMRELGEGVAVVGAADVTGLGGLATPVSTPVYAPGITRGRRRQRRASVGYR